jgi:predicted hotdog family 3-hydroxylacyl-ACP dehydratase
MSTTYEIANFIPQRPPFVFIDRIEAVNAERAVTRYTIPEGVPFVTNGRFTLAGLMENAAQTCAVRAGFCGQNKIGYIGAVKRMQVHRLPAVGETLTTEVTLIQEVLNISLVECITRIGQETIATASLKLAIID